MNKEPAHFFIFEHILAFEQWFYLSTFGLLDFVLLVLIVLRPHRPPRPGGGGVCWGIGSFGLDKFRELLLGPFQVRFNLI